ncbi:MAG: hypothetical protein JW929_04415 [Anaerolineales bacterium]|nr:hypothetical protein [Anaerolineales bacterium]
MRMFFGFFTDDSTAGGHYTLPIRQRQLKMTGIALLRHRLPEIEGENAENLRAGSFEILGMPSGGMLALSSSVHGNHRERKRIKRYNWIMPVLDANTMDFISSSPAQTQRVGAQIGELLRPGVGSSATVALWMKGFIERRKVARKRLFHPSWPHVNGANGSNGSPSTYSPP